MVENKITLRIKDKEKEIIDYPGNDRLRQKLIENHLHVIIYFRNDISHKTVLLQSRSLLRIVFVVDSAAFSKNARDVAELFYTVALENVDKVCRIIIWLLYQKPKLLFILKINVRFCWNSKVEF